LERLPFHPPRGQNGHGIEPKAGGCGTAKLGKASLDPGDEGLDSTIYAPVMDLSVALHPGEPISRDAEALPAPGATKTPTPISSCAPISYELVAFRVKLKETAAWRSV
jgi:hypothetical protein